MRYDLVLEAHDVLLSQREHGDRFIEELYDLVEESQFFSPELKRFHRSRNHRSTRDQIYVLFTGSELKMKIQVSCQASESMLPCMSGGVTISNQRRRAEKKCSCSTS